MKDEAHRPRHPIQVAARRAGLNAALLRAWERRYGAVEPWRSETQQRLYSDAEIERLRRLRIVTEAGRRIRDVSGLDDEQLAALVEEDMLSQRGQSGPTQAGRPGLHELRDRCLEKVRDRDDRGLRRELERAVLLYDPLVFLDDVVGTMMEQVGRAWAEHRIDPSHEHTASITVRALLEDLLAKLEVEAPRGRFAVVVPAGERHELGAFGLAVALATCGCDALRLGAELPAASIVDFAHDQGVDAVAVSVTWEGNLQQVHAELTALRRSLDPDIPLLVGGWGSHRVRALVEELGAHYCVRVRDLPAIVDRMLASVTKHRRQDEVDERSVAS